MKTMRIVKEPTEKANCLSKLLGNYVVYLERYNHKMFVDIAKHYEILLTRSLGETVVFNYSNQQISVLAHCKRGEPHDFETYFNYYYNIYKVKEVDLKKQYYLGKLKAKADLDKEYYYLEDRTELGYRKLTEEEVQDIDTYIKWHNSKLKLEIELFYKAKQHEIIFNEEEA